MIALAPPLFDSADFSNASKNVLYFLAHRLGLANWILARRSGDDWIIVEKIGENDCVVPGAVYNWCDTLCSRLQNDSDPQLSLDVPNDPIFCNAPIRSRFNITSYIGIPIRRADGSVFV